MLSGRWRKRDRSGSGKACAGWPTARAPQRTACHTEGRTKPRIADELRQKLGVEHAASTIRKYMHRPASDPDQRRRASQNWRTFLKNHANEIYAFDFVTHYSATFQVVYVFVVMQLGTRRVVHTNVTSNPTLAWVKVQLRDLRAFGAGPLFLIHDNDGSFGQFGKRRHGFRCNLDLWLERVMGIRGVPTPSRAPNANAVVARFNLSLRREALDPRLGRRAALARRALPRRPLASEIGDPPSMPEPCKRANLDPKPDFDSENFLRMTFRAARGAGSQNATTGGPGAAADASGSGVGDGSDVPLCQKEITGQTAAECIDNFRKAATSAMKQKCADELSANENAATGGDPDLTPQQFQDTAHRCRQRSGKHGEGKGLGRPARGRTACPFAAQRWGGA